MTITLEINEDKIREHIEKIVSEQIACAVLDEMGVKQGNLSYRYHVEIREIIREVMKEHFDGLAKEAVNAAAKSIENKAIKSKLIKLLEE